MRGLFTMRPLVFCLSLVTCVAITTSMAWAVTYRAEKKQTKDGQDFEFSFNVLPSDGTPGWFTIEARGDYFGGGCPEEETLGFKIENPKLGDVVILQDDAVTVSEVDDWIAYDKNGNEGGSIVDDDVWWTNTWDLDGEALGDITGDDVGTILIDLFCSDGRGVQLWNNPEAFVGVELTYTAIPIPGTVLLLGGGLVGLMGFRWRIHRNVK